MKAIDTLYSSLEQCKTTDFLEDLFKQANISELNQKVSILKDYMGVIGTDSFGQISDEEEYELAKEIFFDGRWVFINGGLQPMKRGM